MVRRVALSLLVVAPFGARPVSAAGADDAARQPLEGLPYRERPPHRERVRDRADAGRWQGVAHELNDGM
jgi:hypothetical protein